MENSAMQFQLKMLELNYAKKCKEYNELKNGEIKLKEENEQLKLVVYSQFLINVEATNDIDELKQENEQLKEDHELMKNKWCKTHDELIDTINSLTEKEKELTEKFSENNEIKYYVESKISERLPSQMMYLLYKLKVHKNCNLQKAELTKLAVSKTELLINILQQMNMQEEDDEYWYHTGITELPLF